LLDEDQRFEPLPRLPSPSTARSKTHMRTATKRFGRAQTPQDRQRIRQLRRLTATVNWQATGRSRGRRGGRRRGASAHKARRAGGGSPRSGRYGPPAGRRRVRGSASICVPGSACSASGGRRARPGRAADRGGTTAIVVGSRRRPRVRRRE
jgi:hypothetical protein